MAGKLYAIKSVLILIYGLLLTAVGFHIATWQWWALGLLTITISFISYLEGKYENGNP